MINSNSSHNCLVVCMLALLTFHLYFVFETEPQHLILSIIIYCTSKDQVCWWTVFIMCMECSQYVEHVIKLFDLSCMFQCDFSNSSSKYSHQCQLCFLWYCCHLCFLCWYVFLYAQQWHQNFSCFCHPEYSVAIVHVMQPVTEVVSGFKDHVCLYRLFFFIHAMVRMSFVCVTDL